jgi:hypothetical protein
LNYDSGALHIRQAALGMNPRAYNPFPYPPTFLLILAPFGALGLGAAFVAFMGSSFALYLWSMLGGRYRSQPRLLAAILAPATVIALISGQSGRAGSASFSTIPDISSRSTISCRPSKRTRACSVCRLGSRSPRSSPSRFRS